ncbi:hypothetical protein [uncultured Clostridium sp.]|uniref:hypothetical protein n=1 Tax=uncultured Clostridium sp. TaxID=59620 RepID=UPI00258E0E3B|nr:hypothetical protein [uncultured Clostridium sp.]
MGSSLTSQIAAKSAANCDARLKYIYLEYKISIVRINNEEIPNPIAKSTFTKDSFLLYFDFIFSKQSTPLIFEVLTIRILLNLTLLYRVITVVYIKLILMKFGYRHRALRCNLLSKDHSKGFSLQSLTQNHQLNIFLGGLKELIYSEIYN